MGGKRKKEKLICKLFTSHSLHLQLLEDLFQVSETALGVLSHDHTVCYVETSSAKVSPLNKGWGAVEK